MNCGTCQHVKQWRWLSTYYWWTVEHVSMWSTGGGCLLTTDELWNMSACEALELAVYLLLMNCGTCQHVKHWRWLSTYYWWTVEHINMWHSVGGCLPTTDVLWNMWNIARVDELLMNCGTLMNYWWTVEHVSKWNTVGGCLPTIDVLWNMRNTVVAVYLLFNLLLMYCGICETAGVDELLMNCGTCQHVKHCRWQTPSTGLRHPSFNHCAIGSRKLSANEQLFCWYSNSSQFVTNNSDKTWRVIYSSQQSLHHHK